MHQQPATGFRTGLTRSIACFALLCASAFARTAPDEQTLLITGARILAPDGTGWLTGSTLRVADGRIVEIAPLEQMEVATGARYLAADGLHVVPGLIDLHTHLLLHPYDEASWNDQVLRESLGLRTARGVAAARTTLEAGFTTLRELGTEGAGYADVGLRDALAQGIVPGPRLLVATRAIVASGAYGPSGFDPRWELPVGAEVADGVDGVRVAVRRQIAAGADWIKLYADYRRRPGDPSTPTFTVDELRSAVREAHSAGRPVAAHASTDVAIRRAVEAGVDTIEHGTGASLETLRLMAERGVVLCPTLAANEAIAVQAGWVSGEPETPRQVQAREMMERALQAGVTIACGSDAGVFAHGDNVRELELLVDAGMSAADALASATSVAADTLGMDDLGRLARGAVADLVLVVGDPLLDVSALRRPALVIQGGAVVSDRRGRGDPAIEREVVGLCERFLAGLGERRFAELEALLAPDAVIGFDLPDGDLQGTMSAREHLRNSAERLEDGASFREWLSGEPTVLIDGGLAIVWAPYLLEQDGQRASGIDVFQLLRVEGVWRFLSIAFTNRPL